MEYEFHTADAFTSERYQGAQIAVIPRADGLDAAQMQRIAAEFNLSETVFVFRVASRPDARRLRIFSPTAEIDFAGHPIIAAAHVLASIGDIRLAEPHTQIVFEQNAGPVDVHVTRHDDEPLLVQFQLRVRPRTDHFVPSRGELATILGLDPDDITGQPYKPLLVSCGRPYLVIPLRSRAAVRKAAFSYRHYTASSAPSMMAREMLLFATQAADRSANFHARLVGPEIGVNEDPPIGSSIPAFAGQLCAHDHVRPGTHTFAAERGTRETRLSVLHVEMENKGREELGVRVGGPAVLVSRGTLIAPA